MWFMRFAIDAAFLDPDGRVLRIAEHLRPWRLAACKGAKAVVELPPVSAAASASPPATSCASGRRS